MKYPNKADAAFLRSVVGRWLRLRGEHVGKSIGLDDCLVPRDKQAAMFGQLAADADHSWLLWRLLSGEEPMPFDEWKRRTTE